MPGCSGHFFSSCITDMNNRKIFIFSQQSKKLNWGMNMIIPKNKKRPVSRIKKPMLIFISYFILISSFCNAQVAAVQATPPKALLALSKADHTLAIVDPVSLKVIARIPVGQDPHEVVASTDGKTAYVSIYGGGSLHELNVIDLVAQKALPNVDTRPLYGPHGLTFANGKVWF